jgi:hypothetical protein
MPISEKQDKYIRDLGWKILHGGDLGDRLEYCSLLFCDKSYRDIDAIDAGVLIDVLQTAKNAQYHADMKREASRSYPSMDARDSGILPSEYDNA